MFAKLKAAWSRLAGGGEGGSDGPTGPPVEYKGYSIRAAPFRTNGQYQTAGIIQKEIGGSMKEHRFIRAEAHQSLDEAISFAILKAKQIIDERGDRIFA